MAINRYQDLSCDSCGEHFDGDPIDLIDLSNPLASAVSFDAKKAREIQYFWLCGDCATDYPNGAKDFFIPEYWEDLPLCVDCNTESVEEKGHSCDYCLDTQDA